MANTIIPTNVLSASAITRRALLVLENSLTAAAHVNKQYKANFAKQGGKIGDTLNIRKPPRYVGRLGNNLQVEDAEETSIQLRVDKLFGVDLEFTDTDLLLSIDDFSDRFLKPAVARIANYVDEQVLATYAEFYNLVGTPGTTPNALLTYLLAGVKLDDGGVPQDEMRSMVISPIMQAYIVDALKGLFQQASAIASQYTRGRMGAGPAGGWNWFMDQNCPTHTVGAQGGTPLVNGASQTGSSLITDGWTAAVATRLKRGDVFTIAGVNRVNLQSRIDIGTLQQFVVTADADSDGAGNMTISIKPEIVVTGAKQTVSAAPANNAALTVVGAANTVSPQGMGFHRDAIALVTVDQELPRGVDMAAQMHDEQLGLSLRLVRQYNIDTNKRPCRLETLFGVGVLREELGVRVAA